MIPYNIGQEGNLKIKNLKKGSLIECGIYINISIKYQNQKLFAFQKNLSIF